MGQCDAREPKEKEPKGSSTRNEITGDGNGHATAGSVQSRHKVGIREICEIVGISRNTYCKYTRAEE